MDGIAKRPKDVKKSVRVGRWLGLQTAEATTAAGAPSFAYFTKGGYDDGIHYW